MEPQEQLSLLDFLVFLNVANFSAVFTAKKVSIFSNVDALRSCGDSHPAIHLQIWDNGYDQAMRK
jgi:hypothetical protein